MIQSDKPATNLTPLLAEEKCNSIHDYLQPRPAEASLLKDTSITAMQSLKSVEKIHYTLDNFI